MFKLHASNRTDTLPTLTSKQRIKQHNTCSNCTDPKCWIFVFKNSTGTCLVYTTAAPGQPVDLSEEVCLYTGTGCVAKAHRPEGGVRPVLVHEIQPPTYQDVKHLPQPRRGCAETGCSQCWVLCGTQSVGTPCQTRLWAALSNTKYCNICTHLL